MGIPNPIDEKRLTVLFDSACKNASDAENQAAQASVDIAKELTQYIEKIALADAATIALLVSFVGAHAGRLQPPWLLRAALVALFLGMSLAMFRNWIYPRYITEVYTEHELKAKWEREQSRLNLCSAFPAMSLDDGNPIDVEKMTRRIEKEGPLYDAAIKEHSTKKTKMFKTASRCLTAALACTVAGMVLLIGLAWVNF